MAVQYPKKERGGINPIGPSYGEKILRDPVKSIHTRKHEPVNMSDVTYMVREQDDRINEAISYYAKGVNPMVEVSYSNNSGSITQGPNVPNGFIQETKNPYKIMKDGAFRPPIMTQAELLPLSRQKFSDFAAYTNPGLSSYSYSPDLFAKIDKPQIMKSYQMNYTRGNIQPTAFWKISYPTQVYTSANVSELKAELNNKAVSTPISQIIGIKQDNILQDKNKIKDILLKSLSPNFSIIVYDSGAQNYSVVNASIKDKENIAISSAIGAPIELKAEDGRKIQLKDYQYSIVNTTPGMQNLMLTIQHQPDLKLERNSPLYSVGSNISAKTNKVQENIQHNLYYKTPVGSVYSNLNSNSFGTPIQMLNTNPYTKKSVSEEYRASNFNSSSAIPIINEHNIPTNNTTKLGGLNYDSADRFS